jgi:protein-S-isoprenylcysteine O-methyltransferase Ste14
MDELVYKASFFLFFVAYMVIRFYYGKPHKKSEKKSIHGKNREKALVGLVSLGSFIIPMIWVFSDLFLAFDMGFPDYVRVFGITILLVSLWLFYWVHKILGRNWSPVLEIQKDHKLITEGPYKRVRHPMYTQTWLLVIGQFLILSNWIAGTAGIITWAILYFIRVPKEEEMMLEEFGEEYQEYMGKTGRLLPRF